MKWLEIITLRSPSNIHRPFVDEIVKEAGHFDTPKHLVEIKIYHHSVVETDLSIHIHWNSEPGSQNKSPLGLRFSDALRNLGLLNHSVWVEKEAVTVPVSSGKSRPRNIPSPDTKDHGLEKVKDRG